MPAKSASSKIKFPRPRSITKTRTSSKGNHIRQIQVVVSDVGDVFTGVRFQVAVGVVGLARAAAAGVESVCFLACRGAVGDGGQAAGAGGVSIGQIVNLAIVATAAVITRALQRGDVAAQVVGQRFVVAVAGGGGVARVYVVVGRCDEAAEVVVGEVVGLPVATHASDCKSSRATPGLFFALGMRTHRASGERFSIHIPMMF